MKAFETQSGGRIDFRAYRTPEEAGDFHKLALTVSEKTYQAQLMHEGIDPSPSFKNVLAEMACAGAFRG
jgi:hypothetical protein